MNISYSEDAASSFEVKRSMMLRIHVIRTETLSETLLYDPIMIFTRIFRKERLESFEEEKTQ